jgi:hypothetical protein
MRKHRWNENFLLVMVFFQNQRNCIDLLKLFDSIFSICAADFELFNFLFHFRSRNSEFQAFFEKLNERYKNEKLKSITDWIKKNLGHDFIKK